MGRLYSLEFLRNIAGICLISNSCAGLKQLPELGQEGILVWTGSVLHSKEHENILAYKSLSCHNDLSSFDAL